VEIGEEINLLLFYFIKINKERRYIKIINKEGRLRNEIK